jgi:thiamine biosynthesis lipoprotein
MATSGDYRNFFEANGKIYSHTIDTRTGRPVTHTLASVTVVNELASRADALATALLVMGPEEGMAFAEREQLAVLMLIRTNGGIEERQTAAFAKLRDIT